MVKESQVKKKKKRENVVRVTSVKTKSVKLLCSQRTKGGKEN